ncbi:MAG: Ig-like domain-containing protein, partial [Candidatus Zixiibacteriota bacterium]
EILEHEPVANEAFVEISLPITVSFSEDINPKTVNDSNFIINPSVAGTVSYTDRQLIFTPNNPLSFKTVYSVTLRNNVKDIKGRLMEEEANWLFTTRSEYPEVVSVVPAKNELDVSINSLIEIYFTKDIDASTISLADLKIVPATSGTISYSDRKITFTPDAPFDYGKSYDVTVLRESLQDTSGYYMATNYVWKFTTTSVYPDGLIVPLKDGNYWNYTRNYYTTTFGGDDTIKVDTSRLSIRNHKQIDYMGELLVVFYWNWYNVATSSPKKYYEYVRNTIDGLWWMGGIHYNDIGVLEETIDQRLWFKYPVNLNDTWDLNDSVSLECTAIDEVLTTPLGDFECIVYREMSAFGGTPKFIGKIADISGSYALLVTDYYMVPEVGLVGYKVWGDGELIYEAVVNGYVLN